jgi:AGCS family alanine or glycine:cation symporter
MEKIANFIRLADEFVWGPFMLVLLVGTGIFLTIRLHFLPWRNLGYALRMTLSKEARTTKEGTGDISPFSALTTALAATIGTGNIVGVATAMVSGGPGALVWMWISACFGLSSKFSECMLAIKYREVNEKGEMSGGPMYTMKKAFRHKKLGAVLGWMFALFAVLASFGIGNMTQANSISGALYSTFQVPETICGIILTLVAFIIIVGGIKKISKVSSVVVPFMAVFYVIAGLFVIIFNYQNLPEGIAMIFRMAFSMEAVGGGLCGSITAAMMNALHYGVARGVFSNEAGMGSAAITAAAATTDSPVKQGYVNMTGTFWDTIVVCTITGLCIASSGVLGVTETDTVGRYTLAGETLTLRTVNEENEEALEEYSVTLENNTAVLVNQKDGLELVLHTAAGETAGTLIGEFQDEAGNHYQFGEDGVYTYDTLVKGAALTILAFKSALGDAGGSLVCIGIVLFAFSTILGWEYHGEKAFEYLLGTYRYNLVYRIVFSAIIYVGATTALDVVWNFSDIANALMAIPNLICLLALSGVIAKDAMEFQKVLKKEKNNN